MELARVALFGAALLVVASLARPPTPPLRLPDAKPVLPRASTLLVLFKSHRHLLTDFYWLQATYRTGVARSAAEYGDIAYYAQLITDLDPDFRYAYVFGGVVPPYNLGRETWVNTRESTAIVEKGLRRFPDDLQLRLLYAYNLSYFDRKYRLAADELARAAKLPGCPGYVPALASRMYATTNEFDAALSLTDAFLEQAQDEETRAFYAHRRKEILLERILKDVESAARVYHDKTGRWPLSPEELYLSGDLQRLPLDPLGGSITIDRDGRAASTAAAKRLHVFLGKLERPIE